MHKLDYYKNKFSDLYTQGSSQWLKGRASCFGGSEMSTILGENTYETCENLLQKKIYLQIDIADTTQWGHWFENVSKFYIQQKWGEIHEFGSIPHPYYPVCYSPDGLLVIDNELVLLEIKNPIMRGINKIPEHYFPQVKSGMCILNVKYTLFAQFRFRRCSLETPVNNYIYDRHYHKEYRKRCKDQKPISWGYLYWEGENKLVDLSQYKDMVGKLGNRASRNPKIYIETEFNPTKGYILKWKLFECVYASIPPDHFYLSDREDELWELYNLLYMKKKDQLMKSIDKEKKD